ncbi:MAG: hypothetical protein Cons2KO_16660 [Congregibacter sp.]
MPLLRPLATRLPTLVLVFIGSVSTSSSTAQSLSPDSGDYAENWYRTEVLIFVREEAIEGADELWDPSPSLTYPTSYRYLIDPGLADQRLTSTGAYHSKIDENGLQHLTAPAPEAGLDESPRPDALLESAGVIEDLSALAAISQDEEMLVLEADTELASNIPTDPNTPFDPNESSMTEAVGIDDFDGEIEPDPNAPLLAVPYQLLEEDSLEFRRQAQSLRRQGNTVVFHGSWWSQLNEPEVSPALIIDQSGDPDTLEWPALQGSLHIYRTRYLHLEADLWINHQGAQLPDAWPVVAPPLSPPSVFVTSLDDTPLDPWNTTRTDTLESLFSVFEEEQKTHSMDAGPLLFDDMEEDPEATNSLDDVEQDLPGAGAPPADDTVKPYPWRHAVATQQSRRMRSGEIHYIDHPVIGILVRISTVSEDSKPVAPAGERAFRERHALPLILATNPEGATQP